VIPKKHEGANESPAVELGLPSPLALLVDGPEDGGDVPMALRHIGGGWIHFPDRSHRVGDGDSLAPLADLVDGDWLRDAMGFRWGGNTLIAQPLDLLRNR